MSNTTITPTVGASTLAGVASKMGLAMAVLGGGVALAGIKPTQVAVNAVVPVVGQGQRVSARGLGAGAIFALPSGWRGQLMLLFSGTWTAYADARVQGSPDGGVTWVNIASVSDPVLPGCGFAAPGARVYAPGNGVIRVTALDDGPRYNSLQVVIQNGDGSTSISVDGFYNVNGAV